MLSEGLGGNLQTLLLAVIYNYEELFPSKRDSCFLQWPVCESHSPILPSQKEKKGSKGCQGDWTDVWGQENFLDQ